MMKSLGGYKIGGRAVVFGGYDLVGDQFTKDTDFGKTRPFIGLPVYYDHALGNLRSQIGVVTKWVQTEEGIDVEIEIDRAHKYAEQIMELVRRNMLGMSTGAIGHLVERLQNWIKTWPVGELSLTPTPAEPRTVAYAAAKSNGKAGNRSLIVPAYVIDSNRTKGHPTMDKQEL